MTTFTREQSVITSILSGFASAATFGSTPTEGNLLVAVSVHRSDQGSDDNQSTPPTISGSGWTLRVFRQTGTRAQNNDRRALAVFTKVAEASEPTTVTITWLGWASTRAMVQEFEASDANYPWIFLGAGSADAGAGATGSQPSDMNGTDQGPITSAPDVEVEASDLTAFSLSVVGARITDGPSSLPVTYDIGGNAVSTTDHSGFSLYLGSAYAAIGVADDYEEVANWSQDLFQASLAHLIFGDDSPPDPGPGPDPEPNPNPNFQGTGCAFRPVSLCEIKQRVCSLAYGQGACTAAVGVTGQRKCFNTRTTCQDPANFDPTTKTLRLVEDVEGIPLEWGAIPSLKSFSISPTRLNIAGLTKGISPLGLRSAANIRVQDHRDGDTLTDPYVSERLYDPWERGTFWGKWLARHRDWSDIEVDLLTGDLSQPLNEFRRRTLFLEEVQGPDADGGVSISCRDVLSRLDGGKARAPRATDGTLNAGINNSATTLVVLIPGAVPDPTLYAQMGASDTTGLLRIGDEIIRFAGRDDAWTSDPSLVRFTGLTRGAYGTTAAAHDAGERVQWGYEWVDKKPFEIVRDLFVNFGGVPADWIDMDDWSAEHDRWLRIYDELTGFIIDPKDVDQVVGGILETVMASVWTDVEAKQLRFRAARPADEDIVEINDQSHILVDTMKRKVVMAEQVSSAEVWYGLQDALEDLDDPKAYRNARISFGPQFGLPRVRSIASRWLKTEGQAAITGSTLLQASGEPPIYITLELGIKDAGLVGPGTPVRLKTRILQDETGTVDEAMFVVTEAVEFKGERVRLTMRSIGGFPGLSFWVDDMAPDWATANDSEKLDSGFWTEDDGTIGADNPQSFWT